MPNLIKTGLQLILMWAPFIYWNLNVDVVTGNSLIRVFITYFCLVLIVELIWYLYLAMWYEDEDDDEDNYFYQH